MVVLATNRGFVPYFTPDGRTAEKQGEQEYEKCESEKNGKIYTMVMHLTDVIEKFRIRQLNRLLLSPEALLWKL